MERLFEKFILEYYARECPRVAASAAQIPWALDDGQGAMLPLMQSDITLRRGNDVLIIDAKYYAHTTQTRFDAHTLHSANLYQIFTYVKNATRPLAMRPIRFPDCCSMRRRTRPSSRTRATRCHGNRISVRTLDLDRPFAEIAAQLDAIAEEHFGGH